MARAGAFEVDRLLSEARTAYSAGRWSEAREAFLAARSQQELAAEDLLALGDSAWWLGINDEALAAYERVFQQMLTGHSEPEAAKLALGLGFLWMLRGDVSIGSGWISRGQQLLSALPDCVEQGYGLVVEVEKARAAGQLADSIVLSQRVREIGNRFDDPTLISVGRFSEGAAFIHAGELAKGMSFLDEAMLGVAAGTVDRDFAGNLYCEMMGICSELADFDRARRWTDATEQWCNRFTSAVMFWGVCRLHRSQLLHLSGDWATAQADALEVVRDLADMNVGAVAECHYLIAEIHRLRGEYQRAEESFTMARELGRDPQPGLALLRLAQGQIDAAAAGLAASIASTADDLVRFRLLSAQIDVSLARDDLAGATEALEGIAGLAAIYPSPGLQAGAWQASGAVRLAEGRHADALTDLRRALNLWQKLRAPYQVARVRELLSHAYEGLGDIDSAESEMSIAYEAFSVLGASGDTRRSGSHRPRKDSAGGLDRSRDRGPLMCCQRPEQPRNRCHPFHLREDRCSPPFQHLRQAWGRFSNRSGRLRLPARSGCSPEGVSPTLTPSRGQSLITQFRLLRPG